MIIDELNKTIIFDYIIYKKNKYILDAPLILSFNINEYGWYCLEIPIINCYCVGQDIDELILDFSADFAFVYDTYVLEDNDKLDEGALKLKEYINNLVKIYIDIINHTIIVNNIYYNNIKYILYKPLILKFDINIYGRYFIDWVKEDCYWCYCDGKNMEELLLDFYKEFEYAYNAWGLADDKTLNEDTLKIKTYINTELVKICINEGEI